MPGKKSQPDKNSTVKKRTNFTQASNGTAGISEFETNQNDDKLNTQMSNGHNKKKKSNGHASSPRKSKDLTKSSIWTQLSPFNILLGLGVMCVAAVMHQRFVYQMHENAMWFTNIKDVEREISFRTEAGLYYSYFKQVVHSPSFLQGVIDLTRDNQTEQPDTINVLARMNIYQEVILAGIHRLFSIETEPILFYIHSVFALQGVQIAGLYGMTWMLSGSWLSALLTAVFFSFNRYDTTRVYNSISLRESFSLPFIWVQAAALTVYFKPQVSKTFQNVAVTGIFLSTFAFCLGWQFNQFIMMLQSFSLFGVWVLGVVPTHKIRTVVLCQLASLLMVCVLQFGNKMILSSWAVAFMLGFLAILFVWGNKSTPTRLCGNLGRVMGLSILSLVMMAAISALIKVVLQVDSDEHISKFLLNKLGIGDERDFDSRLYLCLGIFGFITKDVFNRLTSNLVFPLYAPTHLVLICALVYSVFNKWRGKTKKEPRTDANGNITPSSSNGNITPSSSNGWLNSRPELVFHVVQAVFFGSLALFTLRMKYFWTPYICVFAAVGISHTGLWSTLLYYTNIRHKHAVTIARSSAAILVLAVLTKMVLPDIMEEMEKLSEFWDPDTVELMEWIVKYTPPSAAFTGSMQLLAGVKLCTGRRITNHPHYEDKYLRHKTKELYQIYGRRTPEEVHSILTKYKSSYIILEDSICRAPSGNGCRLPDVMDIDNGVIPDVPIAMTGLVQSTTPRFCEEVRNQRPAFTKYFKTVFVNKTFRLYKVL